MKRLSPLMTLALSLILILCAQPILLAQVANPTNGYPQGAGQYENQIRLFDEFARKQMALDKTVGLSIGFIKDDFVWAKGYGYADLENKSPAKAESAYRLASVSKPMTALAVLQLVEKGKIDLDAEVQTYVPYFPKKQWPVTVRQVLGHLGGISHYKNPANELHIKEHKSTRDAIAIFENFDLIAEPGTRYSYSSYGYNLLGAIIEAASGMLYGDYMRQNIWQPLAMTDTRMDDPLEVIPNRVRGYQLINGQVKNSEFIDISSRFAAGGTRSTVPDLLKFAKGIMDGKLLKNDTMNAMATSMSTRAGRLTNYGMGWQTEPANGRYMLVHSGGQNETRTLLYILPTRKMALAVGVNFEGSNPGVYLDRLFQLLTGSPLILNIYSSDKVKAAAWEAIRSTFDYGLSDFERTQKSLPASDKELVEAFSYFNGLVAPETLKANSPDTLAKIRQGAHPVAKQAFTKIGAFMAQKLGGKNGASGLERYAAQGGLAFFQDYITLTKSDASVSKDVQFNEPFAALVTEMARDWNKSNTDYVRQLWLMPDADVDAVAKTLRRSFAGATTYPNLVDGFFNLTRQFVLNGDRARALKTSQVAVELYPEAPGANFLEGIAWLVNKDQARAVVSLKKAATLNPAPNGPASAGGLNNIAYQLAEVGMVEEAMAILQTAIEMYPKEANLYDSLGEFQLKKGEKAKALASYKKALELDPAFGNAAVATEIVKKLTEELAANPVKP
ncbi:MAG TPA: serine hydrolase [Pyrinomonadaceae bacterium]|nr:serine hydrolase [Pyrinomonadaceae bacterium]